MKKLVLLTFMVLALVISGCSAAEVDDSVDVAEAEEMPEEVPEEPEDEGGELPIHPDQIPYDITILEPNSSGYVYMEATFKNNSDYPITRYHMKVHLKDKNDTTYLSSHNTVMPGETSPIFDSFGPETLDPADYEVLTLAVRAILDNGDELDIEYDFKLGQAYWDIYEK
ncbi:hypothetical protein [Gudongella sp. SC589]|uniref:hypothetical protein n=1 Tax=Gudongella sp. SC589 TaxID=3385990 RepID=UPI003904B563